ncbi:MAG: DUF2017 family protein [Ilumatobacter sp.]|uniref:DUF2017 family protein n=1 Tax=Ilumatobacter sp. TaxID=1967498 RepID=UPI00329A66B4
MTRRFKPPIFATTKRGVTTWTLNIGEDEQAVVADLLGQLRTLLNSDDDPDAPTSPLLARLFPNAYADEEDAEKEAEYQRLMREELVASRLHQIEAVGAYIASGEEQTLDEGQVIALMQSVNAVRVVLGTMLDVSDDDDSLEGLALDADDEGEDDFEIERSLYAFLSWLLEWIVRSLRST